MTVVAANSNPAPGSPGSVASAEGASSFWLHLLAWFLFHLAVVIAWGERNSWPDELLLCLLALPISTLVIWDLYQSQRFGLAIGPELGQQEQLIAALVLAVGLASGQVLLISGGLVCLAVAWLRPARPGVDWTEWLKVPLLALGAMPFWLDFDATRHPFARLLDDPVGNPLFQLPLALKISQALLLTYGGLIAMIVFVHGRIFWIALPALPVFTLFVTALPRLFPAWNKLPHGARFWLPWIAGSVLLAILVQIANRLEQRRSPYATGQTVRRWFEERRYPPWLAILVVAIVQALPFQTLALGSEPVLELAGTLLLTLLLAALRLRTPKGPIHSRSVAMVAGALALTLLAEFAASDPLRHLALGFVIIGLFSWHCFWGFRIFITAGTIVVVLFGLSPMAISGLAAVPHLFAIRAILTTGLLGLLGWLVTQPLPPAGAFGYDEDGWVPSKRFALILLGLMMLFQTASAFWPEHTMPVETAGPPGASRGIKATPFAPAPDPDADFENPLEASPHLRYRFGDHTIDVAIIRLRRNPYLVESPERTFERIGWQVLHSSRLPHPKGESGVLKLERAGEKLSLLWWFELGDRAFANPLYARRVLWSSWHLADRNLRLVRLEADGSVPAEGFEDFARRLKWFPEEEAAPTLE